MIGNEQEKRPKARERLWPFVTYDQYTGSANAVKRFSHTGKEIVALIWHSSVRGIRYTDPGQMLVSTGKTDIFDVAHDCRLATGARSKCGTSVVDVTFSPEVSLDKRRIRLKRGDDHVQRLIVGGYAVALHGLKCHVCRPCDSLCP